MKSIVIPPEIEKIFEKPGRDWTPNDRTRVRDWLWQIPQEVPETVWEAPQLGALLRFTFYQLRKFVKKLTSEDAEDMCLEFFTKRIDSVMDTYDPTKGTFWTYLLQCLRWFCLDEKKKVWKHQQREIALDELGEGEKGEPIASRFPSSQPTPHEEFESAEEYRIVREWVNALLPEYPNYHKVIWMRYFEGKKLIEIAKELDVQYEKIKTWHYRAKQLLKQLEEYLRKEGLDI